MKYYIIAGELSGDRHASELIKSIKTFDPKAQMRGFGGDNLKEQGVDIVRHINDLAIMGFWEVVQKAKTVLHNLAFCKKDILEFKPDCIILVDYPGFNLRIASFVHSLGIKVYYYISPQVWAWKKGRIKKMKKILDKLFVILPFEKDFYAKHSMVVEYYGNPLLDEISQFSADTDNKNRFLNQYNLGTKPIIALLPGSRKQEINKILPLQLQIAKLYPQMDFVIAGVNAFSQAYYKQFINSSNVFLVYNSTYNLLSVAKAGLIGSGTATLETALFNVPQIVCYKSSWLSYIIGTYLVKIRRISLVNIILKRDSLKEFYNSSWTVKDLNQEFIKLINNAKYVNQILDSYQELKQILGNKGASEQIALSIIKDLKLNEKDTDN